MNLSFRNLMTTKNEFRFLRYNILFAMYSCKFASEIAHVQDADVLVDVEYVKKTVLLCEEEKKQKKNSRNSRTRKHRK